MAGVCLLFAACRGGQAADDPLLPVAEGRPAAAACNHEFITLSAVEATCISGGNTVQKCILCSQSFSADLPALGHVFSPWTTQLPALSAANDREERSCVRCGQSELRLPEVTGGGDESAAAALAQMPAGEGTYYDGASGDALRELIELYRARQGTLNQAQADLLASALQAARLSLSYHTSDVPMVYITAGAIGGEYATAEIVFVDTDGSVHALDSDAEIRIHGNSTTWTTKKSYNIKLSVKAELFGVDSAKKWVLIGNQYDCTRIRHAMVYSLADAMGIPFSPDYTFVDAYVNGQYWGSYLLVEKVDVNGNSVNIEPERGDFLIELEKWRTDDDVTYIKTSRYGVRVGLNEPEVPTEEELRHVKTILENFETALASGDWSAVTAVMDVDSFVNYYILHELTKDVDCGVSSTRFFCRDGILYGGPVWDFDLSFGNINPSEYPWYYAGSADATQGQWATTQLPWFRQLYRFEEFKTLVQRRYEELVPLLASVYEKDTEGGSLMDLLYEAHSESFLRTSKLIGCRFYAYSSLEREPDKTYEKNFEYLRDWIAKRDAYLRKLFAVTSPR